jgi:hypothetical protein
MFNTLIAGRGGDVDIEPDVTATRHKHITASSVSEPGQLTVRGSPRRGHS